MNYIENFEQWVNSEMLNEEEIQQLHLMREDDEEIKDRFYKNLEFGTGGLRGIIGLGTNRINKYTIRKATQGLANYLNLKIEDKEIKVAIAYDSRNFSKEFALEAAMTLVGNNIKVHLFKELRPTPELSFAVRELNCDAGIVITASHNPAKYNGYKVYNEDGGQITLDVANQIQSEVMKLHIFDDVKICNSIEAEKNIQWIGKELDNKYLQRVIELIMPNSLVSKSKNDLRIVYTPIHGTGLPLIKSVLSKLKYEHVYLVESQCTPDGNFPTVETPNPEEREALKEGIKLAEKMNGDIVLGTDPDADRVGIAVRNNRGEYVLLSGNQIGSLLTHYICSNKENISDKDVLIKTIVTSELGAKIAENFGASVLDTLTGFKFIGEKIKEFETDKKKNFLFGYEESYGYLAGTFVRDKDAIISSVLIVEMAAYYKSIGKSLLDILHDLYIKFGYYNELLTSISFEGITGMATMKSIMEKFRNVDVLNNNFSNIAFIEDYNIQEKLNVHTLYKEKIGLPSSNVLKIRFDDESWFAIRPSGTEPKLKIYYSTNSHSLNSSEMKMNQLVQNINSLINNN